MNVLTASASAIALMMAISTPALCQSNETSESHSVHHTQATPSGKADIPESAIVVVNQVDTFNKALASADFDRVKSLMAPEAIILESGGVERSRDEYLGHHAKSDASFLAGAHVNVLSRTARINGDLAWVATESEVHAAKGNKPLTLLSTETMILGKRAGDWRIVHIHWSSRPKN